MTVTLCDCHPSRFANTCSISQMKKRWKSFGDSCGTGQDQGNYLPAGRPRTACALPRPGCLGGVGNRVVIRCEGGRQSSGGKFVAVPPAVCAAVLQRRAVLLRQECKGHPRLAAGERVGKALRTDKAGQHRLVPQHAHRAPAGGHGIGGAGFPVGDRNEHPAVPDALDRIALQGRTSRRIQNATWQKPPCVSVSV